MAPPKTELNVEGFDLSKFEERPEVQFDLSKFEERPRFSDSSYDESPDFNLSKFEQRPDYTRFTDPMYRVGDEDFEDWKEWNSTKPDISLGEGVALLGKAAKDTAATVLAGIPEAAREVAAGNLKRISNSLLEGVTRGTAEMGVLEQQVKGKAEELYRKARTPAGLTGDLRQLALQTGMSLDDKDLAKLQKEVEISTSDEGRLQSIMDEGNQRNKFELFKKAKELNRMLHMARTGQENLLENILVGDQVVGIEDVNDRMTAAIGEVADITSVVPVASAGRRLLTKAAAEATERAAGKTGRLSGVFKEWAEQIDATDVPLVGGPLAGAQAAAKMATDTAQAGSIAVEVGAETLKRMPTQKGIIESVAKSTRVPEKLRRAVGVFRPLDPALKVGAETVEGALIGAGVGGALGAAAEGEEGFWSGLGSGGALGGISTGAPSLLLRSAGAIHSKLDPIGKRELEADIRREGLRQVKDNLSPQSWNAMSFDDKATATTARHILGERFNVNVLDTEAFANLKAPTGVTAMYDPATKTIFVDSSSPTFKQDFLHEFGEALFDSPVVNKGDIELEIEAVYGKTELNRLKRQYAEQFVKARKVAAGEKSPKASKEEVNKELLALYQDEPNWITREIFAESVMDTLIDKNLQRFRNSSGLRRALIKAKESVFRKMGVELDATGRSLLFGDDLKNDPKLKSRIEKYTRDLDRYYKDTRNRGKATSRVSIRQQPDHPAAGFVENAEGVKENNFARINESGKVEMKNAQEVRKENAQKRKEIKEEIAELEVVDASEGDFLSSKPLLNNPDRFELRGKQIPQSIKDLPMMARSKPTIEDLERAIKNGDILESWIHAIGPEDFWNVVRRRGGNVPVQKYEYMPYEFFMSQNGNLAVRVLNMDKIRAKADLLNQQGKLSYWNNDVNAFMESLKDYVMAHKEGKSAATVMSPQQRNAISGFFGLKGVGDLRKQWKASGDKGVFETQRIDRIASIDFTGRQFPFQQEYANLNFSAPRMAEMDAAYMKAVEAGDMDAAQSMVDEAARQRGYTTGKVYHGTKQEFTEFASPRDSNRMIYFSRDRKFAEEYPRGHGGHRNPPAAIAQRIEAVKGQSRKLAESLFEQEEARLGTSDIPVDRSIEIFEQVKGFERQHLDGMTASEAEMSMGIRVIEAYLNVENLFTPDKWTEFKDVVFDMLRIRSESEMTPQTKKALSEGNYLIFENPKLVDAVFRKGYDGMLISESGPANTIAVRDPSLIKSADPVTYDADGSPIPISQRFDPSKDDIRFSAPRKDLWDPTQIKQKFSSAKTSISYKAAVEGGKAPVIFKIPGLFRPNTVNADIGGGKYDQITEKLKQEGVTNYVFDPFNRSTEHNANSAKNIKGGKADTATVSNVLNVIKEPENRRRVIEQAADAVGDDGVAYFSFYEAPSGPKGNTKRDTWQEGRKSKSYVEEVNQVFKTVEQIPKTEVYRAYGLKPKSAKYSAPRLDPRDPITADSGISEVSDAYDRFRVGTAKLGTEKRPVDTPPESNISSNIVPDRALVTHMEMFNYPTIPAEIRSISNPKEKRDALVSWMADNLEALYYKFDEDVRHRSTHWYDGGQRISALFADRYSVSMEQAAGVIAALSPQRPWFMNVAQAEQVIDVYQNHQDDVITREEHGEEIEAIIQAAEAPAKQKRKKKPGETRLAAKRRKNYNDRLDQKARDDRREVLEAIYGKSIRTLDSDPELQGWAIRTIAQTLYGKDHRVISPEGDPMGFDMLEDGSGPKKSTWGGVDAIKKSVNIIKDGSIKNISENLGDKHKVRNFFNNLVAPNSPFGDATMDTHAVAAAMLMPFGAESLPVKHNFSSTGSPALGVNGTYHVFLDAYREAARRVGIQPRQMQSVTWEAVRSLFPSDAKKPKSKHRLSLGNTKKIWQNNNADEARKIILRDEIPPPTWARPTDSGRVDRDTPLVGEDAWKQADVGGGVIFGGRRRQPTSGSGGGVGRFSAPRGVTAEVIQARGLTSNLNEAGYVTPRGDLIDFSGRSYESDLYKKSSSGRWVLKNKSQRDYHRGQREIDHRDLGADDTGEDPIGLMQSEGNIRIDGNSGFVDIGVEPTDSQFAVIKRLSSSFDGELVVDLTEGNRSSGITYPAGTKPAKIVGDIRRFYRGEDIDSGIRFSAPRQLNNRGGFVARSPSGHRAVRTSNRAGIRVYDPKGRFIGSFDKLAAAEIAISDDQEE